jgi:hypothetical protein
LIEIDSISLIGPRRQVTECENGLKTQVD